MLNALKSNNVKATFHVTTKYINQVEVVTNVQRAFQEGHVIGLRYPTSLDPTQQSDDEIRTTLKDESAKIHTLIQQCMSECVECAYGV